MGTEALRTDGQPQDGENKKRWVPRAARRRDQLALALVRPHVELALDLHIDLARDALLDPALRLLRQELHRPRLHDPAAVPQLVGHPVLQDVLDRVAHVRDHDDALGSR
eukprot:3846437-Pyramimonas_sp.AAC.1